MASTSLPEPNSLGTDYVQDHLYGWGYRRHEQAYQEEQNHYDLRDDWNAAVQRPPKELHVRQETLGQ
jgi:hypothetical protein